MSSTRPRETIHSKWEIFAQEDIIVQSHNVARIELRFGVQMSIGVIIVSQMQQLKTVKLSIQNESVVESTYDIVISIQNNSNSDITIEAGDALCFLTYINI
jgi:dUTPase